MDASLRKGMGGSASGGTTIGGDDTHSANTMKRASTRAPSAVACAASRALGVFAPSAEAAGAKLEGVLANALEGVAGHCLRLVGEEVRGRAGEPLVPGRVAIDLVLVLALLAIVRAVAEQDAAHGEDFVDVYGEKQELRNHERGDDRNLEEHAASTSLSAKPDTRRPAFQRSPV